MKTIIKTVCCILVINLSALAANYTVKPSGGNYSTIQACATAMSAGDTCTVYAGDYSAEGAITVTAGSVGSYKTLTVNGTDTVTVEGFVLNSHTKLIGNCVVPATINTCGFSITNPSSPNSLYCVNLTTPGTTDVYIENNVMKSCGASDMIESDQSSTGASYIYVLNNTTSYGCGTPAATANCPAIALAGNHFLIQGNDVSHYLFCTQLYGDHNVFRNNSCHDSIESEGAGYPSCVAPSGNCHNDTVYMERGNNPVTFPVFDVLIEGNTVTNAVGTDAKGMWAAADWTSSGNPGCYPQCTNVIGRFNVMAHFGGTPEDQTSGFLNTKWYNNTIVDPVNEFLGNTNGYGPSVHDQESAGGPGSANGAEINNLYYFPEAVPQSWGFYIYRVGGGSGGDSSGTGFVARNNLAWCNPSTSCAFNNRTGTQNAFASDAPGNKIADPLLVNYAANDFHLQVGSAALATGSYLTTANGSGNSSTSLVVSDAGFFQDGLGLNAAGVQADCISVTTVSNHVCITAVNHSTNTLTLANPISWASGDPVYLYSKSDGEQVLTGGAPDLGAYPYGSGSSTNPPAPPTNLSAIVQ